MVQRMVDAIREARGVPSINHPNFGWAISPDELGQIQRTRLFEVFNGHPTVNNLGGGGVPGLEETWDRILSSGKMLYGIAVDDAHYFKRPDDPTVPRPGTGWVYVRSATARAARPRRGARARRLLFVHRRRAAIGRVDPGPRLTIEVKAQPSSKYRIQFIGRQGSVLSEQTTPSGDLHLQGRRGLRAREGHRVERQARVDPAGAGRPSAAEMNAVVVVAAVIERDDAFLLTLRPDGTHLAGHWEFPGGKVHPHETHAEALRRELFEELDIVGHVGELVHTVTHAYPEKTVELFFYRCGFEGEPKPMMGQEMRWVPRERARHAAVPRSRPRADCRVSATRVDDP